MQYKSSSHFAVLLPAAAVLIFVAFSFCVTDLGRRQNPGTTQLVEHAIRDPSQLLLARLQIGMFQSEVEQLLDVDNGVAFYRGVFGRVDRWAYYLPRGGTIVAEYEDGFLQNANLLQTVVSPELVATTRVTVADGMGSRIFDRPHLQHSLGPDPFLERPIAKLQKPLFLVAAERLVPELTLPDELTVRQRLRELGKGATRGEVENKLSLSPPRLIPTTSWGGFPYYYRLRGPRNLLVYYDTNGRLKSAQFTR